MMKLIFVTGGIVSGLGKGVITASISKLLQTADLKIGVLKMDPYLQVDAGTMSPYEHGECYVTYDGGETDLDLGNYERFLGQKLSRKSNITTGQVYLSVIEKERRGDFLGKTVQIVPHITNEIKSRIENIAKDNDITIVEVGGTVGDIESAPFLEAIRQFKRDLGRENVFYIHLALLLELTFSGEIKTKPIQHSIMKLREYGISPNMLVCRTGIEMDKNVKNKISMLCDIDYDKIIEGKNVSTIYEVPQKLKEQNVGKIILDYFGYSDKTTDLDSWNKSVSKIKNPQRETNIVLVGKYTKFEDTYKSILEAFVHAGSVLETKVNIHFFESDELEQENSEQIFADFCKKNNISGILVPGGFGKRGVNGMIKVAKFARENKIPYLGICLGMQVAVIEFAQNVCKLNNANSAEFDENAEHKVIDIMESQKNIDKLGGTMRLGDYKAVLSENSIVYDLYGKKEIFERHRHRYEVNPKYHNILEENGLLISGKSPDGRLVEFVENSNHPFFVATQAHPEFNSTLEKGHPLFIGFVKASLNK